uniref:BTB domain-containing protein n=1 Tax=Leersia perrieri TaxID=77586 RepID=A0A0D9VD13_9ORYZ
MRDSEKRGTTRAVCRPKIGDLETSDVVVRLRTPEGRDEWLYCHSGVLAAGSGYFSDRLSDEWPTCQILGSRYCVEVYCQEPDLSSHVTVLRLLYAAAGCGGGDPCSRFGVRGSLGILQAAVHLACPQIAGDCVNYLESAPWDEADEEEILRTIPCLGPDYECVLARLRPIDPAPVTGIFLSAFRHATSSMNSLSSELKSAAQEQLEYMLTEDDDAPLLVFEDDTVKSQVKDCVAGLLNRFSGFMSSILNKKPKEGGDCEFQKELHCLVSDVSWVCQILSKLEMMKCIAVYWVGVSLDVVEVVDNVCGEIGDCLKTRLKVIEVSAKVLEAIAFGNVVIPTEKRCGVVNVWIDFARRIKPLVDQPERDDDDDDDENGDAEVPKINLDSEVWQSLESAVVSIVLTLPSNSQADILSDWLQSKHAKYPDLTEAFEVWCYRSKVAKRRLSFLSHINRICGHCGGADWIVESGVKCISLACPVFYERRKIQRELKIEPERENRLACLCYLSDKILNHGSSVHGDQRLPARSEQFLARQLDDSDGTGRIVLPLISLEIESEASATVFWRSKWAIKSLSCQKRMMDR